MALSPGGINLVPLFLLYHSWTAEDSGSHSHVELEHDTGITQPHPQATPTSLLRVQHEPSSDVRGPEIERQ